MWLQQTALDRQSLVVSPQNSTVTGLQFPILGSLMRQFSGRSRRSAPAALTNNEAINRKLLAEAAGSHHCYIHLIYALCFVPCWFADKSREASSSKFQQMLAFRWLTASSFMKFFCSLHCLLVLLQERSACLQAEGHHFGCCEVKSGSALVFSQENTFWSIHNVCSVENFGYQCR